jgi:hypothetical protein
MSPLGHPHFTLDTCASEPLLCLAARSAFARSAFDMPAIISFHAPHRVFTRAGMLVGAKSATMTVTSPVSPDAMIDDSLLVVSMWLKRSQARCFWAW